MAEPETPSPVPQPQSPVSVSGEPLDESIQDDPLLGSGSFIDPNRNDYSVESPAPERNESNGDPEFASDSVIDAKPISMLAPGEDWSEAVPKAPKVRDPEEMAKRPSWLPDDWNIELRVRSSGVTAGTIDRDPVPSFPRQNDSAIKTQAAERNDTRRDPDFGSDSVIDAKPMSMLAPGKDWSEAVPRAPKVRDTEEMAKPPSWLLDDWKTELRVQSSGAITGTIYRYYVAPSGKRKLRSKNEVLRFLASGGEPKGKSNSDTDAGASESPGSQKKPKSSSKRKKAGAIA